jgi:predicted small lipoprotein YifL
MKRPFAVLVLLTTILSLSACGQKGDLVKPAKRNPPSEMHHHAD